MKTNILSRVAALGGILAVVLQMTGQMMIQTGGQEPPFNAGANEIIGFFMNRHTDLATAGSFISLLSFLPLIFFLGINGMYVDSSRIFKPVKECSAKVDRDTGAHNSTGLADCCCILVQPYRSYFCTRNVILDMADQRFSLSVYQSKKLNLYISMLLSSFVTL